MFKQCLWLISLSSMISLFPGYLAQAQEAPPELTTAIESMETAANQRNLEELMQFYSQEFTNSDGLRYDSIATSLEKLWQNFPRLNYEITLDSWSKEGEELVAETTTTITGMRVVNGESQQLNSTIRSRQYFQGEKLVKQEIISEATDVTSGNPPEIEVVVPTKVKTHEQFNFDIIVQEPLEDGILLGAALEEQTGSDRYLQPSTFELDPLPSGGIFKIVTAPALPGTYWLSGIIVRADGMVTVTRRVNIEAK